MLRTVTVWSCSAVLVVGLGAAGVWAADTKEEIKELDKLEGYQQLPKEKDVKKELTDVPKQPIETIIVWSEAKPTNGKAPLKVDFTADPPPGVSAPTYTWQFGDGSAAATGQSVSHSFTKPGVYKVLLKVTNASGALGEDELRIKVTP
jgi:PKD repeat protein